MKFLGVLWMSALLFLSSHGWSALAVEVGPALWSEGKINFSPIAPYFQMVKPCQKIKGTSIYFEPNHPYCYGHSLLDGCFTIYTLLKEHNLLENPSVTLFLVIDKAYLENKTVINSIQLIKDIFSFKEIRFACHHQNVVFENLISTNWQKNGFFASYPESYQFMGKLQALGFSENVIFQEKQTESNSVREFVDLIFKAYQISPQQYPLIKNRVILTQRRHNRILLNAEDLEMALLAKGYEVITIDFEQLSIREQIIEVMQAEYLLGTYGSNLTNAIFLDPRAKVVVMWPKQGKYFISRTWDIIYSAFLSTGVTLIEYDKPEYDQRDQYTDFTPYPADWFYPDGNVLKLNPKITLDDIVKRPHPLLYHLFFANIYVDPEAIINLMIHESSRHV